MTRNPLSTQGRRTRPVKGSAKWPQPNWRAWRKIRETSFQFRRFCGGAQFLAAASGDPVPQFPQEVNMAPTAVLAIGLDPRLLF